MNIKIALAFLAIAFITISTTQAKGGRGGGRGSSRVGGSGGRRGSTSYNSGSFSSSRTTAHHPSGGWFHGFFHTPYHYTYVPSYTNKISTSSYHIPTEDESPQNKDTDKYAVGYALSRSLSNNFFSIFDMVHDISKIPDKIKNKEFTSTTTTEGPVSTYNLNHIIDNPFPRSTSILKIYPEPYIPDHQAVSNTDNLLAGLDEIKRVENLFKLFPFMADTVEEFDESKTTSNALLELSTPPDDNVWDSISNLK